jgi:hypothetical protein
MFGQPRWGETYCGWGSMQCPHGMPSGHLVRHAVISWPARGTVRRVEVGGKTHTNVLPRARALPCQDLHHKRLRKCRETIST